MIRKVVYVGPDKLLYGKSAVADDIVNAGKVMVQFYGENETVPLSDPMEIEYDYLIPGRFSNLLTATVEEIAAVETDNLRRISYCSKLMSKLEEYDYHISAIKELRCVQIHGSHLPGTGEIAGFCVRCGDAT